MAQKPAIQVSPEEYRFLRRFFRRQALPWVVGLALVAIAAARMAVPDAAPGVALRIDEAMARIAALEAQNASLRTELEAMGQRMPGGLERRLAAAEGRIAAVERSPAAAGGDDVAERVERMESRLASATSTQETVTRSNLSRLHDLEERMAAIEGVPASAPAAPMP
jgi:hypothetical protein